MLHRCNETTWRHVGRAVLLRAAVEISLGDDVPLLTALEVVLLHALDVLVVEALLLHEVSLPRVGMESMSILPLGHLGSVLCNSETIYVLNFLRGNQYSLFSLHIQAYSLTPILLFNFEGLGHLDSQEDQTGRHPVFGNLVPVQSVTCLSNSTRTFRMCTKPQTV